MRQASLSAYDAVEELEAMLRGKRRHVLYLLIALGMLGYGLPRLELGTTWELTNVFALVWTLFAFVIVAAHVNALMLPEEKRKDLARVKRAKTLLRERRLAEKAVARSRMRG
jgi:uncharacterized membrane protein